jgi:hypothetical protein
MGLFASSILVKYSLLNNSGSLVYAGTSSNSLRIWGAQLELAEYSEDILNDYVNNYRYVRTTGQVQNFYGIRFGSGVNGDQSVDTILIGGSSGTRMNNVYAENTAFFINKAAKRGTEIISLFTTSTSIAASSSYTFTSGTNLILDSESFATNWSINDLNIDATTNVLSPIGSIGDVKKLRENNINGRHWMAQVQATGQNYSGVLSFYARAAERSILGVEISNFVTEAIYYIYNLSSGTISVRAPAVNDYSNVSASMISVGSGWYRCQLFWRRNAYSTATGNNPTFTVHDNLGAISYTGDNTSGLYLWGVQYCPQNQAIAELGYPLYIPTTSTALTNYPVSSGANIIGVSNRLGGASWSYVNGSYTNFTTDTLAPDQTATVLKYVEDGNSAQHAVIVQSGSYPKGQNYVFSAYLKAIPNTPTRWVSLNWTGSVFTTPWPVFDIVSGTVITAGNFSSVTISAVGSGWYRCTVQSPILPLTPPGGSLNQFTITLIDPTRVVASDLNTYLNSLIGTGYGSLAPAPGAYPGNSSSGIYVWGVQLTSSIAQQSFLVQTTGASIAFLASSGITVTTSFSIINTTSYNVLSTAYVSNLSGNLVTGASPDTLFVGQQYRFDTRLSGDPLERLNFDLRKRIKDTPGVDGTGVTVSDDRRRIPSNPVFDATKVAGLELLKKTNQTFSYNRYTPVSGDNVYYNANDWFSEVGRSQRARMAIGGDTEVHFFDKRLDETKQIPRIAKYDAAKVMGLELVSKTSSIINLAKYTPLRSADIAYYKKWDWYSDVPRSQYAKLAYGIGDGSPYIYDNMLISGDQFVYQSTTAPFDYLTIGSSPYSPAVFSTANTSDWGTVLNTYGVWPYTDYPATSSQGTFTVYRSFTAPYTGNYGLQGAVSFFSQGDPYGLNYVAYASTGATPARPGGPVIQTGTVPNLDYDWQTGPVLDLVRFNPAPSPNDTNLVEINFTGYILWPGTSGTGTKTVSFYTYTDDGFQLSINNTLYIDNWIEQGPILYNTSMAITLNAGQVYAFNAWWYENAGGAAVRLFWNTGDGQGIRVIPNSAFGTTPYSWTPSISGSKLTVSIDGSPRLYTSSTLPTFSTVSSSLVNLSAGTHILKFDVNLDNVGAISQIKPGGYAVRILIGSAAASTTSAADIVWDTRSYRAGESNIRFAYTTSVGKYNDAAENISLIDLKAAKRSVDTHIVINNRHQSTTDAGFTMDAGRFRNRSWYQLAPLYSNYSHIIDTAGAGDLVRVGDYYGGTRHSNNKQETMAIWFAPKPPAEILISTDSQTKSVQKSALRSSYSSTTIQTVIRTNRIAYSERLDRTNFWPTTGATVSTSTALLSPLLPYRAVSYDADQIAELFYNQPNQIDYRKWYTIVPLSTRTQSWTSNAISIINVTSSNSQHGAATLINFNIGLDNYYSYGMFVKQRTGVNRVRLYVGLPNLTTSIVDLMGGSVTYDLITDLTLPFSADLMELGADFEVPHYADFDLVAGTVINRLNVSYANITDRGNGWKLIKIAGPVTGTADSVTDTLPAFRDFVSIRDSLELSSALFDLAPGDLLALNGAVDLTDAGGIEELL